MKCKYSVTFEFETAQPITVRGEVIGTSIRTVAARALDDAVEAHPKTMWSSIVLLVERSAKDIKEPENKE
jgi:hypothetical protein